MRAGLFAGAIAAIIAALVSLPLHSPLDSAFNSATVAVATLVLGGISGLLWSRFGERALWYVVAMSALLAAILVVAFIGNNFLDRFVSFVAPLAAIAVVVTAALTPPLSSYFSRPSLGWKAWTPAAPVVAALILGFALITQGDAESGDLALPPPPATATPMAPAATATTAAPTAAASVASTAATAPATSLAPASATPVPAVSATEPLPTATPADSGEQGQTFVIGEGSKITFTVEEELGRAPVRFDAVVSSTGLTGMANLDGQPSVVTLDLHSLQSDQQFRDRYIRSQMFPDTPDAMVTVEQLPELPQSFFDGEETMGKVGGSLQIGDRVTPLEFDVTARHDGSAVNILGLTTFTWEQLGLDKPTARSVVYLADEVRVQVLLVARAP